MSKEYKERRHAIPKHIHLSLHLSGAQFSGLIVRRAKLSVVAVVPDHLSLSELLRIHLGKIKKLVILSEIKKVH